MNLLTEKIETNALIYKPLFSIRNIAAFYLVLMCIQYIPLEGWAVSPVKVAAMCASPLIWLVCVPYVTRAVVLSIIYLLWYFATMYLRFDAPRFETMGYHVMFFSMFITFYNLIYAGAFTKEFFLKLVEKFIYAFIIVLIIQQSLAIIGINTVPFLNYYYSINVMKCQSLTWEPSSSARIMGALFYAFLKVSEFKNGEPLSIGQLWKNHKWLVVGFLYAMISMLSGTAIVCLCVISLYFLRGKNLILGILIFCIIAFGLPETGLESAERAENLAVSSLTLDVDEMQKAEGSGASRITPLLNAFKLDFNDPNTWFGYGTDQGLSRGWNSKFSTIWTDYGIINWFLGLLFIFSCCIKPFFSLPTLMFFIGIGGSVGNVSYAWGILMIFTCISYFTVKSKL